MIGQKRRQPSASNNETISTTSQTAAAVAGGRARAISVGGVDSDSSSSSSSDDERGSMHFFQRSSWFCRKFWKTKNPSSKRSQDGQQQSSQETSSTSSSSSSSMVVPTTTVLSPSGGSSTIAAAGDFVQRQRHRYRRFYKSVIKRSRTTESFDRRTTENVVGDTLGDDYAVATEEDWKRLETAIARLLDRLNSQPDDGPAYPDEECVICVTGRASMQTFPCGHKVLCKTCFVRTIQVVLQDRQLPLRCILCRSRIVRLKQQPAPCRVVVKKQPEPPGSYYLPPAPSPLPPSGIRRPGYM